MGVVDDIKKQAASKKIVVQTSEAEKLAHIFNKMFYLDKDIENEVKFLRNVMTRGAESQERVGLHASAMLVSENAFCCRQQVLSLVYHMKQGEQTPIGLMRIFEEGNAVHEKWQRLLIRAGYSTWDQLDNTQFSDKYMMSYTPDIICRVPEFYDGLMVGEIKSVNTFSFKKQTKHPSAWKQCQWYMHLTGIHKGFVLSDDKNSQEFRIEVYDYDPKLVAPFIDRAEQIVWAYRRLVDDHKLVSRPSDAKSPTCKRCKTCPCQDSCWGLPGGRVRL